MIEDKRVWLTFDAECKDGYDRTLAYVHRGLETNDFAQRLLLREAGRPRMRCRPM